MEKTVKRIRKKKVKPTICKRCGRILKNPESIIQGYGPTCWRKFVKETRRRRLF